MDLHKQLSAQILYTPIPPREEKIQETIALCKDARFPQERDHLLTYWEFLFSQLRYTRKYWWLFQAGLLLLACQLLPAMEGTHYQVRSLGVIGCLFVVLMVPELWRNKESGSTQVEAACFYSLRQVYAARITLFGMVDVALLTAFSLSLGRMGFTMVQVLSQFLLPSTVTACICFSLLCGKQNLGEAATITACLVWAGAWWLVLMNETIYLYVAPAVWTALFGAALILLGLTVRRAVRTTNQSWEVAFL